ncbi:transglycosylase domain-containing protein [Alicyclobacillus sp.]|uniref:transglycosylase domain-containing protein n=1 Tax=Alicyclobacillus sp. TaxID=61169 RepID=UPI0025C64BB7|nr:transglycosylase domain-containing protein [Alicyclobacillus sp.]
MLAGLFAALIAAVAVFTIGFFALVELYPFDASKLTEHHQPTVVYDKNGQEYMTIAGQGAYDVTYDQLPKDLVNAVVATEDHNFWDASSIDFKGILRAAFIDLWTQSYAQGASTIQEQLAKIVYLNDKKTLSRKFSQIVLGVQINRHFTKQEILAMYLNRAFFGENAVGVGEAAYRYFGVDLHKGQRLTLSQSALLAGLLQAPSAYDPIQHPDAAIKRRNQVLDNLVKYGYITEAQAKAAKAQTVKDMGVSFHNVPDDAWDNHPLFTNFLFHYAEQAGIPQEELLQGGLKVYTTVDPKVQKAIDTVFWSTNYNGDFPGPTTGTVAQGAAIFIDPKTGGVLGAAGSRKQGFVPLGMDRALQAYRSPGSSIKPLVVYGPAIESGKFGPDSILNNQPHDFGGGYAPRNDNSNAPAQVTLRYALATSQNVAAVWTLQQIGIQTGADFAANAGIPITSNDRQHLSIALGNLEKGVSPFLMAQAYSAFANQGIEQQAHLITRVVNAAGDTLYTFQPAAKRVMSARTAAVMTDLLQDVVQYGTGTAAQVPGWGVAGKTGTVQYDASLSGDHLHWINAGWFDGYTPTMVGSIYLGYDVPSPEHHLTDIPHTPSYNAAKIFGDIVRIATQGMTPQQFGSTLAAAPEGQAVYGLNATWDPVAQAVQLTWKSDQTGRVLFQVSRLDNGPAQPAMTQPADAGRGKGKGKGRDKARADNAGDAEAAAAGGGPEVIGQTTQPFYEDTAVQPGESYTYTVQALDLSTQQPVGQPVSITVTLDASAAGAPPATGGGGPDLGGTGTDGVNNGPGDTGNSGTGTDAGTGSGAGAGGPSGAGNTAGTGGLPPSGNSTTGAGTGTGWNGTGTGTVGGTGTGTTAGTGGPAGSAGGGTGGNGTG